MNTSYIESHTLLAGGMMESLSNITNQLITDNLTLTALSYTLGNYNSSNLITLSLCQALVMVSEPNAFYCLPSSGSSGNVSVKHSHSS